jgi:hypothetical protein
MLRFLNLNSPVLSPAQPLSSLSSTTNSTPNLSPVSATSTLMTPTDPSPGFDKLNFNFDFDHSMPPTQSLLFETSPSRFHAPSLSPARKSFCAERGGVRGYNAINLHYLDSFSNRAPSTYLPQNMNRCPDLARSIVPPWSGPHIASGNDWLRAEKVPEEPPSMVGARALKVPLFSTVQPAVHAHEVRALETHHAFPLSDPVYGYS